MKNALFVIALLAVCGFSTAAPAPRKIGEWSSPSGTMKILAFFKNVDSPREAFLVRQKSPKQRELLCTFDRDAEFLFSPDGCWIAMNDNCGSAGNLIRFFRLRVGGKYGKFSEFKLPVTDSAWQFLQERHQVGYPEKFDHIYADVKLWSRDSSAVLLHLSGYGDRSHWVDHWYCVYDLETQKASLDLPRMNLGAGDNPSRVMGQNTEASKVDSMKVPQTTIEMRADAWSKFQKADQELNQAYASLKGKLEDQHHKDLLIKAQRDWINFRDATAEFEAHFYEGGSIKEQIKANALERLTRARTKELQDTITNEFNR